MSITRRSFCSSVHHRSTYSVEHDLLGGDLTYAVLLLFGSVGFVHALTLKEGASYAREGGQIHNIRDN